MADERPEVLTEGEPTVGKTMWDPTPQWLIDEHERGVHVDTPSSGCVRCLVAIAGYGDDDDTEAEKAEHQRTCPHKMVRLELSAPLSLYAPTDHLEDLSRQFVHDSFSALVDTYVETQTDCRGAAQCTECDAELEWGSPQVTQALANVAKIAHKHMAWELVD